MCAVKLCFPPAVVRLGKRARTERRKGGRKKERREKKKLALSLLLLVTCHPLSTADIARQWRPDAEPVVHTKLRRLRRLRLLQSRQLTADSGQHQSTPPGLDLSLPAPTCQLFPLLLCWRLLLLLLTPTHARQTRKT